MSKARINAEHRKPHPVRCRFPESISMAQCRLARQSRD